MNMHQIIHQYNLFIYSFVYFHINIKIIILFLKCLFFLFPSRVLSHSQLQKLLYPGLQKMDIGGTDHGPINFSLPAGIAREQHCRKISAQIKKSKNWNKGPLLRQGRNKKEKKRVWGK